MPKYIPESVKLEAMQLFIAGNLTAKEIAEYVSKDGVVVRPPTIYAWAKKEQWAEHKSVAIADKKQEIVETEAQRFARLQEDQLDSYSQITNKATREITELHFDRALDAARAVDIGAGPAWHRQDGYSGCDSISCGATGGRTGTRLCAV